MEQQIADLIRGHADIAIGVDGSVILNAETIARLILKQVEKADESAD